MKISTIKELLGAQVLCNEEKLAHQLERFPEATVVRIPAPGLVELIEQGKTHAPETDALLRKCLAPYVGKLDALVLGCTHYPFVRDRIAGILGDSVGIFDGGEGTARQTRRRLEQAGLLNEGPGSITIENSANDPRMLELSKKLLQGK